MDHYGVNAEVIPNGVKITPRNPEQIIVGDPPRIVFAGRFVEQKNLLQFVRVLAQLKNLDWQCSIVGDGPQWKQILNEVETHGLQDKIELPGWVEPEEAEKIIESSDILFLPSLSEGMPIVGIQALVSGLAIVGSKVGGMVDLVEQGNNGYLYHPTDFQGMCLGLRTLLEDQEKLLTARKRSNKLSEKFDIDAIAEKYYNILKSLNTKS